jgi:uncharacterized protein
VTERVLIDTGPLVALLSRTDTCHHPCATQFDLAERRFLTCWPVLSEVVWLLGDNLPAVQALLRLCDEEVLQVESLDRRAPGWISDFLARYRNLRPDLADAALAYLAEREDISTLFTLDRRDFSVYRRQDGRPFTLLPP